MAFSVMTGFFNPFMSVFAIALGATNYMVGLLVSLPALAGMIGQALGALLAGGARRQLPIVVVWAALSRAFFLLFALLPFLPAPQAWIFVLAVGLMNLPGSVAGLAWTALMQKLFPPRRRGEIFGQRNAFISAVTLSATAVGGWVLTVLPFPANYTTLNLASLAFLAVSLGYLTTLREPLSPEQAEPRRKVADRVRQAMRRLRANRPFTTFLGAMAAFWFGLFLPQALYPILFVREMHMPPFWIGLLYSAGGLSAVLTYRFWGRFSDRHGHLRTLALCATARPLHGLLYCFVQAAWTPSAIEFVFAGFVSGFDLSAFNSILELAPPEDSSTYIAVFNIVNGLLVLSAPLLGVWLASVTSVRAGIGIGASLRLLGVVLLWRVARATSQGRKNQKSG
jgi:MFS family permease